MATTTNYGWTTPDDTDLVKNGADAIRVLGASIDTSMNTALGTKKAGMVLLNTTSFSAVASQDITNVFSSTYENYMFIITATNSTGTVCNIRMMTGTVDSSANYDSVAIRTSATPTTSTVGNTNATSFILNAFATVSENRITGMFYRPNVATNTNYTMELSCTSNSLVGSSGGELKTSTQYTGFRYFPSAGTITGTIQVYGVQN
jgi:hypothetical protein